MKNINKTTSKFFQKYKEWLYKLELKEEKCFRIRVSEREDARLCEWKWERKVSFTRNSQEKKYTLSSHRSSCTILWKQNSPSNPPAIGRENEARVEIEFCKKKEAFTVCGITKHDGELQYAVKWGRLRVEYSNEILSCFRLSLSLSPFYHKNVVVVKSHSTMLQGHSKLFTTSLPSLQVTLSKLNWHLNKFIKSIQKQVEVGFEKI